MTSRVSPVDSDESKGRGRQETYDSDQSLSDIGHEGVERSSQTRVHWQQVGSVLGDGSEKLQNARKGVSRVERSEENRGYVTLTTRFLLGLELRKAKSTASWSRAALEVISGRAAKMTLRRARGPAGRGAPLSSVAAAAGASGARVAGLVA